MYSCWLFAISKKISLNSTVILPLRTSRTFLLFQCGNLTLLFTLILLQTAWIWHAASRVTASCDLTFELNDFFLELPPYLEVKIVTYLQLSFALLPHEGLLHFQLLLFSHLHHHLLDTRSHLLLVLLLIRRLSVRPRMLHDGLQAEPFFRVWIQHFFDQIYMGV